MFIQLKTINLTKVLCPILSAARQKPYVRKSKLRKYSLLRTPVPTLTSVLLFTRLKITQAQYKGSWDNGESW